MTQNTDRAIRPHLGLSVRNLAASRDFYQRLLGVAPAKERPHYAKFELSEPPLNLTLNEIPDLEQALGPATHFGIELSSPEAVREQLARAEAAGLEIRAEMGGTCCYAVQDKFWATDPDGHRWEHFVVTDADSAQSAPTAGTQSGQASDAPGSDAPQPCCKPTCCGGAGATQ